MLKMYGCKVFLFCILHLVNSQGLRKWKDNEYYYGRTQKTWDDARQVCQSLWGAGNGDLVTINDNEENHFLYNELVFGNGNQYTWIGANHKAKPFEVRWVADNSLVTYATWVPGQPDNWGGNERCIHFRNSLWNDVPCNFNYNFICERSKWLTIKWNDNEYYHGRTLQTWDDARQVCQNVWGAGNGDLVTINNKEENEFLYNELVLKNGDQYTWIGANHKAKPFEVRWVADNSLVTYATWIPGQPDNWGGNERCIHYRNSLWNDVPCDFNYNFICERSNLLTTKWKGNEYYYSQSVTSWDDARKVCQRVWGPGNGDLVTVNNKEENEFLYNEFVLKNGNQYTWIGANHKAKPFEVRWAADNSVVTYATWATGQPDNHDNDERCIHFTSSLWNDAPCNYNYNFICERTRQPPLQYTLNSLMSTTTKWNDNEYYYGKNATTWDEARKACQSVWGSGNGDLVTINMKEENDFLYNELIVKNDYQCSWIGANDKEKALDIRWAADNSVATYINWAPGQPDIAGGNKRCMHISASYWYNEPCGANYNFICERTRKPPIQNLITIMWKGSEYYYGKSETTWYEARKVCQSVCGHDNGDFVKLDSIEEENFIFNELIAKNGNKYSWIGASYINTISYYWADGSSLNYKNWAPGQPIAGSFPKCVYLWNSKWYSTRCEYSYWFICEKISG